MSMEAIEKEYGPKTVRALNDFLNHAYEASSMYASRHTREERVNELLIEAITIRLGESAMRAGRRFSDAHPELQFNAIIGARDYAAHGYDIAEYASMWASIREELPLTVDRLNVLLGNAQPPFAVEEPPQSPSERIDSTKENGR